MWHEPSSEELAKLPRLYETENIATDDKVVHMRFSIGSASWYAVEFDPDDELFFGFVNLGDPLNAEWGFFCLQELRQVRIPPGFQIERDLWWTPRKVKDIAEIATLAV